ncbi:MAG: hypothetical protein HRT74_08190 [Flavobacteriales bacterium]|nr:hypothetical protein [Flavobacteriales bacterium]
MSELRKNIGDLLKIVHNPESVIEVYFDANKQEINEVKCLNYNRCKVYNYTLSEYQDCLVKYNINLPELA